MTDIVERLQYYTPYGPITDMQADAWMKEAAEEIKRLRAVLRGIACTDDTCECGYVEGEGPFCELGRARAALGEKE